MLVIAIDYPKPLSGQVTKILMATFSILPYVHRSFRGFSPTTLSFFITTHPPLYPRQPRGFYTLHLYIKMSGPDPQETWRRLQQTLQNAQQQGRRFGAGGGAPKNIGTGLLSLVVLGGGAVLLNNALFNGSSSELLEFETEKWSSEPWANV